MLLSIKRIPLWVPPLSIMIVLPAKVRYPRPAECLLGTPKYFIKEPWLPDMPYEEWVDEYSFACICDYILQARSGCQ